MPHEKQDYFNFLSFKIGILKPMRMPKIYKQRTKAWHDNCIRKREFSIGQKVLLFNSRLRWFGPFLVKEVFPHGAVEITSTDGTNTFEVNGQRLKAYMD